MTKLNRRQFSSALWSAPLCMAPLRKTFPSLQAGNAEQRQPILARMERVMGPFPKEKIKPSLDIRIDEHLDTETISRMKMTYLSEEGDHTPGYLLKPKKLKARVGGILCLHQTTPLGAAEPAGLGGNPDLHYAQELAERGYVTFAPDYPDLPFSTGFGGYHFDAYRHGYQSQTMKGIWNHVRAVDLLQSMPEVDPQRIGCIGHSLGGHNTLFVGAFDTRIRVLVTSCGFTSFRDYYGGELSGWAQERYMPLVALRYHNNPGEMPFDFSDVLAALAPRPLFVNAPLHDANFDVTGVRDTMKVVRSLYSDRFRAADKLVVRHPNAAHSFPLAVRNEAYQFIDRWLRDQTSPNFSPLHGLAAERRGR
jgi:dienelactone hydrolase